MRQSALSRYGIGFHISCHSFQISCWNSWKRFYKVVERATSKNTISNKKIKAWTSYRGDTVKAECCREGQGYSINAWSGETNCILFLIYKNDHCCKNNSKFYVFLERSAVIFMERLMEQETFQPWQPACITLYCNACVYSKYGPHSGNLKKLYWFCV